MYAPCTSGNLKSTSNRFLQSFLSNLETATHLFKGSVGAGLFAMGDCFKNGGLVGATLLMPILAVICVHCERLLIDGSIVVVEKTPGVDFFDYPDTVEKVFEYGPSPVRKLSKLMRTIVETFLCVTQFGFCSIYFVFITENLHQVSRFLSIVERG